MITSHEENKEKAGKEKEGIEEAEEEGEEGHLLIQEGGVITRQALGTRKAMELREEAEQHTGHHSSQEEGIEEEDIIEGVGEDTEEGVDKCITTQDHRITEEEDRATKGRGKCE